MKTVIFFVIISFFSAMLNAQEVLAQQLGGGYQRSMRKQSRAVPRYYICGAGTWKRRSFTPASQKCQRHCQRRTRWWGERYCVWSDRCTAIPEVHHWTRINGLVFQYCHFQDWNNQITMQEAGNFDWQGVIMCPHGMYVYGMRTKLNERDGLAGLILSCRNMRSTQQTRDILIFDGEGGWRNVIQSSNYAVGFKTRFRDSFIYGLKLEMAGVPNIFAFKFNYQFPKNFNTAPNQIDKVIVINQGSLPMVKQISLTHEKQFKRIWQNERGYLNGLYVSQISSQSLIAKARVGIPFLSSSTNTKSQTRSLTEGRRQESFQNFKFGTVETYKVKQQQKDTVHVPPCTKSTILKTVYLSDTDIPYILQLGYTNGQVYEFQRIQGFYRGVVAGEVQTSIRQQKLKCN